MKVETRRREVPVGSEGRVDRVVQELTGLSRARVFGLFDHRCVTLDGAPCAEPGRMTRAGEVVEVCWDQQRKYRSVMPVKEDPGFRILHEDEHLVVLDKSAGVLTMPTHAREDDTLVQRLARRLGGASGPRRVQIVHRLDRGTSGLLVFAKSREVATALKRQFQERKPERMYWAIVAGQVTDSSGSFSSHLATDTRLNQYSTDQAERGKLAITHWEVVRRVRGATLLRVRLETGRRNQIRVHFAEDGHPVLGDTRYGEGREGHPEWEWRRLALHAGTLGFTHPETQRPLRFQTEMPRAMAIFLDRAGKDRAKGGAGAQGTTAPGAQGGTGPGAKGATAPGAKDGAGAGTKGATGPGAKGATAPGAQGGAGAHRGKARESGKRPAHTRNPRAPTKHHGDSRGKAPGGKNRGRHESRGRGPQDRGRPGSKRDRRPGR